MQRKQIAYDQRAFVRGVHAQIKNTHSDLRFSNRDQQDD